MPLSTRPGKLWLKSRVHSSLMTLLLPSDNCSNQSGDGDLPGVTWFARSPHNNEISSLEPSLSQPSLASFGTKLLSVARTPRLCSGWWAHCCPESLRPCCLGTLTWMACTLSPMPSLSPRCGTSEIVYRKSRPQLWTMIVRWHPPLGQLLSQWTLSHPMNCVRKTESYQALLTWTPANMAVQGGAVITKLVNLSLDTAVVPTCWKMALVKRKLHSTVTTWKSTAPSQTCHTSRNLQSVWSLADSSILWSSTTHMNLFKQHTDQAAVLTLHCGELEMTWCLHSKIRRLLC